MYFRENLNSKINFSTSVKKKLYYMSLFLVCGNSEKSKKR
jgi:hypothetical protein